MGVKGTKTFEEKVSSVLNALSDGALLLTGNPTSAETLVVGVVVDSSRTCSRPVVDGEFRVWIVRRMVKQYLDPLEEAGGWTEREAPRVPGAVEPLSPAADTDVDAMLRGMTALERADSDRLARLIRRAMEQLGLLERTVLWLVNVMGFSYAQTSAAVGLPPIELRDTLLRARRELQARLVLALQRESTSRSGIRWGGRDGG